MRVRQRKKRHILRKTSRDEFEVLYLELRLSIEEKQKVMCKTFNICKSEYEKFEHQILTKGQIKPLGQLGQPKKITYEDKRKIKYLLSKDRKLSMRDIHTKVGVDKFSYMTLTRYLKENKYYRGDCIRRPLLRSWHIN